MPWSILSASTCADRLAILPAPGGQARQSRIRCRHSTAMELLQHGVDQSVIALWLGHESVETTQIYIHADLRLKEQGVVTRRGSGNQSRPLPAGRPTARVPGIALIMPNTAWPERMSLRRRRSAMRHNPGHGIMGVMPISA